MALWFHTVWDQECGSRLAGSSGSELTELSPQSCSELPSEADLTGATMPSSLMVALLYVGYSQRGLPATSKDRQTPPTSDGHPQSFIT